MVVESVLGLVDLCQYTETGCDRMFDLQSLSQCGSMYNCLGRSIPEVH